MQGNRALGLGLVAAGAVLGGIMLLWIVTTLATGKLTSGGAVLGLFLVAVLGLPLLGGGFYVLSRGRQEEAEAAAFRTQRRTMEQDRLFRAEQARELGQAARRLDALGAPQAPQLAARLRDFVQDLEHPAYDQADWYEAVELGGADVEALQRYDGLLTNEARSIGELVGRLEAGEQVMPQLAQTIQAWERDNKQRADLLRGRRAAAVSASDLLSAAPALSPGDAVAALKPGDAVTKDDQNYLVETSVSYFSGGRTTWLHRLVSGSNEGWLHVSPGGINLAWLQPFEVGADIGAATLTRDGATCRLEESGAADARVTARGGQQASGTVTTFRYACSDGGMVWVERWPDRARAYGGSSIRPSDLEVWPAEAPAGGSA